MGYEQLAAHPGCERDLRSLDRQSGRAVACSQRRLDLGGQRHRVPLFAVEREHTDHARALHEHERAAFVRGGGEQIARVGNGRQSFQPSGRFIDPEFGLSEASNRLGEDGPLGGVLIVAAGLGAEEQVDPIAESGHGFGCLFEPETRADGSRSGTGVSVVRHARG